VVEVAAPAWPPFAHHQAVAPDVEGSRRPGGVVVHFEVANMMSNTAAAIACVLGLPISLAAGPDRLVAVADALAAGARAARRDEAR
jgi:hypothetical protein